MGSGTGGNLKSVWRTAKAFFYAFFTKDNSSLHMGKPFSQLFTLFTSDNLSLFVIQKGKQLPLNSQENHSLFLQSNLNSLFGKQLPFFYTSLWNNSCYNMCCLYVSWF